MATSAHSEMIPVRRQFRRSDADRRVRRSISAPIAIALGALLTACGSDGTASTPPSAGAATAAPSTPASEPVSTTASTEPAATEPAATEPAATEPAATEPAATEPAPTEPAATEPAPTEPSTTVDPNAPVLIRLNVGTDTGPDRRESVPLNAIVTIEAINPTADEEYHIHDYDLGAGSVVPMGEKASFTFVADRAGEFELESHITDKVLMVLVVVP